MDAMGLTFWGTRGIPQQGVVLGVDNDVVPAATAGMLSVFIRRGPWALIQRDWPGAEQARITIDSLAELPPALRGLDS